MSTETDRADDAKLAELALGWKRKTDGDGRGWWTQPGYSPVTPKFHEDPAAMVMLMTALTKTGLSPEVHWNGFMGQWVAKIWEPGKSSTGVADTLPRAVASAALAALGGKEVGK